MVKNTVSKYNLTNNQNSYRIQNLRVLKNQSIHSIQINKSDKQKNKKYLFRVFGFRNYFHFTFFSLLFSSFFSFFIFQIITSIMVKKKEISKIKRYLMRFPLIRYLFIDLYIFVLLSFDFFLLLLPLNFFIIITVDGDNIDCNHLILSDTK